MEHFYRPSPIAKKFFTPVIMFITVIAVNGLIFLIGRFLFGLGAVTNLSDQFPWGIWIAIDVAAGVALAAGGFTSAMIGHILHKDKYEVIVRPALLTAMLGYTFVATSVMIDIGRYHFIWHPMIMWNGSSVLFEVGTCVIIYLHVLYIEFLPIVAERFIGRVNLPGFLKILNEPIDKLLRILDKTLDKIMFIFIITGIVLSCLHQSSLGTLMVITGYKMHPLWQTPILPLLFLVSAICVGFPMVIFESIINAKSFGLKLETRVLSGLGRIVGPMLFIYLTIKVMDAAIRQSFVHLMEMKTEAVMFMIEVFVGIVIPLIMFFSRKISRTPTGLFLASAFVIFGVLMNRINSFIVSYTPPYAETSYFPSVGEISITLGLIALEILIFRAFVMIFPIISVPQEVRQESSIQ